MKKIVKSTKRKGITFVALSRTKSSHSSWLISITYDMKNAIAAQTTVFRSIFNGFFIRKKRAERNRNWLQNDEINEIRTAFRTSQIQLRTPTIISGFILKTVGFERSLSKNPSSTKRLHERCRVL